MGNNPEFPTPDEVVPATAGRPGGHATGGEHGRPGIPGPPAPEDADTPQDDYFSEEMMSEEMLDDYSHFAPPAEGEVLQGYVLKVTANDVIVDFGTVDLIDLGEDRIRVENADGLSRTGTLKVSVGYRAGFIGEGEISYAGPNARARAEVAGAVLHERLHHDLPDLRIDLIGIDSIHRTDFGHGPDPYEVRVRAAASGATRELADRVGLEVEALYTNGPAGGGGARRFITERIGIVSTLMPREDVRSSVVRLSTDRAPGPVVPGAAQ